MPIDLDDDVCCAMDAGNADDQVRRRDEADGWPADDRGRVPTRARWHYHRLTVDDLGRVN